MRATITVITSSRLLSRSISSITRCACTLERFYLSALGLVYLAAFGSLAVQWRGLYGPHGISPTPEIAYLVWSGVAVSVLLVLGIIPRVTTVVLFVLWFLLVRAGGVFLGYQWENLLLEVGLLAPFFAWRPNAVVIFLHRWLLFRLLFMSGIGKWLSRDPTWHRLTALRYHFETQPLPTPLAWYLHHAPAWFLSALTVATLVIEIAIPFLFFLPRRFRLVAFALQVALQVGILTTGNYAYFNWLTIVLCLTLLMDRPTPNLAMAGGVALLFGVFAPRYGLFTVMTTDRLELVIEGSFDKKEWRAYELPAKPGDVTRRPPIVAPHQPRLDWQLWFASFSRIEEEDWLQVTLSKLLVGEPSVRALFAYDPFPDRPPKYIRVQRYRYRFGRDTWWTRELLDSYTPVLSIR